MSPEFKENLAQRINELKEKAKEKIGKTREELAPKIDELREKAKEKIGKTREELAPKIDELKEKAKEKIGKTKKELAPKIDELKEKAKENAGKAKEKATVLMSEAVDKIGKMKENARKAKEETDRVKEKAKENANKAKERAVTLMNEAIDKIEKTREDAKEKIEETTKIVKKKAISFGKIVLAIICATPLLLIALFSDSNDLYVISIGVPNYRNHYDMDIPENQDDAERVYNILQQSEDLFLNVSYEILAQHGEATKNSIEKAINKAYKNARDNDIVLIYISSHGEKYENNEYLLFPYDFDKESKYKTSFKAKNLIKSSNVKTIVWLDACESGAAAKNLINNNVDLLVSSGEGECSISNWKGSEFTNTLLRGLDCEADYDEDGIVTLKEITDYVVNKRGKKANPIQKKSDVKLVKCN
jgi:hypothetical protein